MATSLLEQILFNVKGGALLPLDVEQPVDPSAEIEGVVENLANLAEAEIRHLARTVLRSPGRGGPDAPTRFRRALSTLSARPHDDTTATSGPKQLDEIQNLLENLDPQPAVPATPRVPLEDIQSMIELLK